MNCRLLSLSCVLLLVASGCADKDQTETANVEMQAIQAGGTANGELLEALKKDMREFEDYRRDNTKGFDGMTEYLNAKKEERYADWEKAAEAGIPEGGILLGFYYLFRHSTGILDADTKKWFLKAAEQGHAEARFQLARHYSANARSRAPTDAQEAIHWFRKAGDQGHVRALFELGGHYNAVVIGNSAFPPDPVEAAKWYRKAAELGHAESQFRFGSYCLEKVELPNPFTPENVERFRNESAEGIEWYRKAAEQGYARAQYWVGMFYYEGLSVPQDMEEATKWLHKAAEQGEEMADRMLIEIFAKPR